MVSAIERFIWPILDELSQLYHSRIVGDWFVMGTECGGADEGSAIKTSAVSGQASTPAQFARVSGSIFARSVIFF